MEVDQVKEVPAAVTTKPSKKEAKKASKSNSSSGTWSYSEDPSLTALPESTITEFYNSNQVQVHPSATSPTPLRPILEFSQANLPAHLAKPLSAFPKPTVIQSACWPYILDGQDMIGIAATGSGKTVAFGIPALIHVANRIAAGDVKRFKPQVLMLSPTRELAMQIQEQMEKYSGKDLKSVVIYGGVSKYDQKALLRSGSGAHILVATPGRLLDLVEEDSSACDLSDVSYLVLDEADRMLDQGFEEAIKKIVARLTRKSRQNVMFSATWPTAIQKIANQYLNSATKVTVGSLDLSANINIEQRVEVVDQRSKEAKLLELLKKYHNKARTNRILIFALYKKEAARIEQFVRRQGYNIAAIHGDLSQDQRTRAIEGFRSGTVPLLVATDVAARGIDIPNVEYVINVTFPLTVEDYCHRIGRTGRAGAKGVSHTLFTVLDKAHSGALINVLKDAGQPVPDELLKFGTTVKKKVDPNYGAFAKDVDMSQKGTKIKFSNDSDSD
ncbi:P-loop containing nucleoside triphosphate hydrolase protein [Phlyctochytrium arcticum]|nr:P-loop containing nucleoside triphosphate hydrolase protein [Phlyctochytrium arcticum]